MTVNRNKFYSGRIVVNDPLDVIVLK
jgi:hypothetical protein